MLCYSTSFDLYLDDTCRDLLEVCEAQLQFGTKAELPVFGGSRGPDISKSIADIQVCLTAQLTQSLPTFAFRTCHINGTQQQVHVVHSI